MAVTLTSTLVRKSLRRSGLLLSGNGTEARHVVGMCIEIYLLSSRAQRPSACDVLIVLAVTTT